MSNGKQFTLYSHDRGPNGWKVVLVLEELKLSYETVYLSFEKGEQKAPEFTKFNPNGRIPALIDHSNNDFVVWESNAIILYLVQKYDTANTISAAGETEKALELQWLFFQASGQAPYFGQFSWFTMYHPEKLPSAIERYYKEAVRVFGVLDGVLAKQKWLVGDKCTIADLVFVPWNVMAVKVFHERYQLDVEKEFPALHRWNAELANRESVKKAFEIRAALITKS
ncbi:uncharacterized protein FIBRA_08872 [Fibroporia radiculosa]|uniref:glutathione transferase n=1 Tax=Fibroporia radiculosa TaxID=599839 RepID=J4GIE8_9APHY|nr:uncharacterized protein FIBRA_08872 [Fibroporia radiculosa]CCM06593.1 predicted protein [Fibroporia radiculosa]